MVKTILVKRAIDAGTRLVERLRQAGIPVSEAFWRYFEDESYWQLMIVTPQFNFRGPTALYKVLLQILYDPDADWADALGVDQVTFVPPTNLFYKHVKHGVGLSVATGNPRDIVFEDVYRYAKVPTITNG
jgi:hypothetical protein